MKIINYLKTHKKIIIINLIIFLSYLALISMIQLLGIDDYEANTYQYTPRLTLIETIKHIIHRGLTWNIRIGEMLYFIVGAFPRWVFFVLNSLMMLAYLNLIYLYIVGNKRKEYKDKYSFIIICAYFFTILFTPGFSDVFLWMAGCFNHLWDLVIILIAAYPFRLYIENKNVFEEKFNKKSKFIPYLIYCFISGFATENVVPAVIFACILVCLLNYKKNKKIEEKPILSICSITLGFIIMVFFISTKQRIADFKTMEFGNITVKEMYKTFWENYKYLLIIAIVTFLIYIIKTKIKKQKIKNTVKIIFSITLISSLSLFAMKFSPYFEIRALLGIAFFIIALITLSLTEIINKKLFLNFISFNLILITIKYISYLKPIYADFYEFNNYRERYFESQAKKLNTIIFCPDYDNPYNIKEYTRLFDFQKFYCDPTYLEKKYNVAVGEIQRVSNIQRYRLIK